MAVIKRKIDSQNKDELEFYQRDWLEIIKEANALGLEGKKISNITVKKALETDGNYFSYSGGWNFEMTVIPEGENHD